MQLKRKPTSRRTSPTTGQTQDSQQSNSAPNPSIPQKSEGPGSEIKQYSPPKSPTKLAERVNKAHDKLHHKSNVHGNKHIRSRLKTIQTKDVRKKLSTWLIVYLSVLTLAIVSSYQSLGANQLNGFTSGKDVIIGLQAESTSLNFNPFTLSGSAENSIAELVFSSVLKYDNKGQLIGDLAKSYQKLDDGKTLEIKLKPNLTWQDGAPLTAQDIIFTINKLKDPQINSPLRDSILGLSLDSPDDSTVLLKHDRALNALDDVTTRIKIAPKHLLENLSSEELSKLNYTDLAISSGLYTLDGGVKNRSYKDGSDEVSYKQINLAINTEYYGNKSTSPLIIRLFNSQDSLQSALESRVIQAYVESDITDIKNEDFETAKIDLNSGVFSFFNNSSPVLSNQKIRQALKNSVDLEQIYRSVGGATPLYSPLRDVPSSPQSKITPEDLKAVIIEAGWQQSPSSKYFIKDSEELTLELVTSQSQDYIATAESLKEQWAKMGIKIDILSVPDSELQANYFFNRNYDILLYGINLSGYIDPYAYWSSSAATGTGLNFSNYRSPLSDVDLDAARTALDPAQQQARLEKFVERWHADAPALPLYTPNVRVVYNKNAIRPVFSQSYVSSPSEIPKILSESQTNSTGIYKTD